MPTYKRWVSLICEPPVGWKQMWLYAVKVGRCLAIAGMVVFSLITMVLTPTIHRGDGVGSFEYELIESWQAVYFAIWRIGR